MLPLIWLPCFNRLEQTNVSNADFNLPRREPMARSCGKGWLGAVALGLNAFPPIRLQVELFSTGTLTKTILFFFATAFMLLWLRLPRLPATAAVPAPLKSNKCIQLLKWKTYADSYMTPGGGENTIKKLLIFEHNNKTAWAQHFTGQQTTLGDPTESHTFWNWF